MQIFALLGFAAVAANGATAQDLTLELPVELTQRRILEALIYEGGVARSAEEIRRRAQLADANSVGQGLSRLRAAWSKTLGPAAKEIFPEARASKGYRLQLDRQQVDVWHLEDLQRTIRERIAAADPAEDFDTLARTIIEAEQVWIEAEKRHREHPTALSEPASDLGKRVTQLATVRIENRKRWAELTIRSGNRPDLVLPLLAVWLNDEESVSRTDIALWRLWIEAKAVTPGTTEVDLDAVVDNAKAAGLDVSVLDGVRRTAATKLAPTATPIVELPVDGKSGGALIDISALAHREIPAIPGLEVNIRSAFVGRVREREQLSQAGVQAVRDRTGHLITITGEPGVGKSRLLAEVVSITSSTVGQDGLKLSWFVGRCPAQGQGLRCWALGEIIKSIAGVRPHDTPEAAIVKLEERLARAKVPPAEIPELVRHLAPLVGGSTGFGSKASSDTERFFAWARALDAIRTAEPIALIFEDLHWADDTLLEFLDTLTEQGSPSGLLVICTGRPEFLDRFTGWAGGGRSATTTQLGRLTENEATDLLNTYRTANDLELSKEVKAAIIERCGGNPLFAEELARMVEDTGASVTTGLPRMVELVVAARLDHLSDDAAHVAYAAAAIGRVFWSGSIEAVAVLEPSALRNALAELVRLNIVQRSWSSSFTGQLEYTFWHAIVRDVAEKRLPADEIAGVHLRVAHWLRSVAGERFSDVVEQIANHYEIVLTHTTADQLDTETINFAIEAFQTAGSQITQYNRKRAGEYFKRALTITPIGHPKRTVLLADHALCFTDLHLFVEGEKAGREALSELEGSSDQLSYSRVLAALGRSTSNHGDIREALNYMLLALPGLELADHDEYMSHKTITAFFHASVGEGDLAFPMIRECWEWCKDAVESNRSIDILAATLFAWMIDPQETSEWFDKILQKPGVRVHASPILPGNLAEIQSGLSGPRAALAVLDAALERNVDQRTVASTWIASVKIEYLLQVGELSRSIETSAVSLHSSRDISPMLVLEQLAQQILGYVLSGETVDPAQLTELDELIAAEIGTNEMKSMALRASAYAHFVNGDVDIVKARLTRSIEIFEVNSDRASSTVAVLRLFMLRLALLVEGPGSQIAEQLGATCNPLSPAQAAEFIAIEGYLAASRGDTELAVAKLDTAVEQLETLDIDLIATWTRLYRSRLSVPGTTEMARAALEEAARNQLEAFGAFGLLADVMLDARVLQSS